MTETAKDISKLTAPAALLGTSLGAFAAVRSLDQIPPWAVGLIETQAVGVVGFLVLLGFIAYFAPREINALQGVGLAMMSVAERLQVIISQSSKLDEISAKIDDVKFNSDVFGDRLTRIEETLINAQRQDRLQP